MNERETPVQIDWQSQLGQDHFVALALEEKRDGTYVDIGAGQPELISNTVVLEREFGWHGALCDIEYETRLTHERSKRNTVYGDAFAVSWKYVFDQLKDEDGWIDYLSLDLEPPERTINLLLTLPFDRAKFRVATIEHDHYRDSDGNLRRDLVRNLMFWHGYLGFAEVALDLNGKPAHIEDWFIHRDSGIDIAKLKEKLSQ